MSAVITVIVLIAAIFILGLTFGYLAAQFIGRGK